MAAHADTALYFGCPDVEETYARFRALGVTVQEAPKITGYGTKLFTISDPDGYHLCFQWAATT